MGINIRQETEKDYKSSEAVVEKAFENAEHSDHKEQILVDKLRRSDVFILELSLVAEYNKEIIVHIMLTKLSIENEDDIYESLALAPVSVLPQYQNKGVGSKLIYKSLRISKELGYESVIVLGHDKYYPRFGFKPASIWGIKAPFDVPDEAFMALELEAGSLDGVTGRVVYSREFFE
jgi:predicted N-acetyltransferase YhbS